MWKHITTLQSCEILWLSPIEECPFSFVCKPVKSLLNSLLNDCFNATNGKLKKKKVYDMLAVTGYCNSKELLIMIVY